MPQQNPNSPAQFPGEDVLLDTLRSSKISDDQRQKIWDVYHTPGEEHDFVGALNKTDMGDDIKQTLYDIRYKGFLNHPTTPQAPSPTTQGRQAAEPFSAGAYQARKGGPILNVNQSSINAFAQGLERMFGVTKPPSEDIPHPFLSVVSQMMTGVGKLADATIRDPIAPAHALVDAVSGAVADVESGIKHKDPRQVAAGTGETLGLVGDVEALKRANRVRSLATGPVEGGVAPGGMETLTRVNAKRLQDLGYTNQHITQMDATTIDGILKGNVRAPYDVRDVDAPKPSRTSVPAGEQSPTRATEAVKGGKASASNQAAAAPVTSQVPTVPTKAPEPTPQGPGGDFRGAGGPIRPYDPQGTRFAKGGTIGMEPLDLMAPKPSGDVRPQVDPITGATKDASKAATPTVKGPLTVPGLPDPLQATLEARYLLSKRPTSPYIASEKAALMSAPRTPLGPEFEAAQVAYDNERSKAILRNPNATAEDKRIAATRLHEGTVVAPPDPVNRGQEAGVAPADSYYKPVATPLTPSSEAPIPLPEPVEPSAKRAAPASHELPQEAQRGLDLMMQTKKLIDEAPTDLAKAAAQKRWDDIAKTTKGLIKYHLSALTPEQRQSLLDDQLVKAERHQKQANAINDIVAGDKMAQALREEMKGPREGQGETVGRLGTKSQFSKATGGPIRVVGTLHGDIRSVIHEMLGDKTSMQFDEIAVNQRAKAREEGKDPDLVQPEGYRRVSPDEFTNMRLAAKQELQELQDNFKNRLSAIVEDRLVKNASLVEEQGEEAVKNIHAQALKELLAEKNNKGLTLTEQIKELRDLIGRDLQRPLYVKKGAPVVDEAGVVSAPGAIPAKSLEVARRIWDKKLNKIPEDQAWVKKADEFAEKSRLHRAIAQGVKAFLDVKPPKGKEGESGYIGDMGPGRSSDIQVPDIQRVVQNAIKERLKVWTIGDDKPASFRGWISPDGKRFISAEDATDHDTVAWYATGKPGVRGGQSQKAFLEAGWIRKENNGNYSVGNLKEDTTNAIEMDLIRNRVTGTGVFIDVWDPKGIRSIDIRPGWEDLRTAIRQEERSQRLINQTQAGKMGGLAPLAGMALGGLAGAVAGGIHGSVQGMVAGGTVGLSLGFIMPAMLQTRAVGQAMKTIANIVRGAGISLKTWFQGVPQTSATGIDPDMDKILKEQMAHADRSTKWIERARQLPATIYKGFDPFAYVADKKNMGMIGKTMMSFDPKGRVFRDLTIPDNQSLYMALADAGKAALGQRKTQNTAYTEIKVDANKAGLREALDRYLNYKAYQRANEVLQEHISTLDSQIQNLQTKLQSPSNTVRQTIALQDDLKETQKMRKDIQDKVDAGKATPGGYTSKKVQDGLDKLEQHLGPQKFAAVQQLAQRTFQAREHILDMLFDSGIISQDAYTQFKARGSEYVPMERIVDDLENKRFSSPTSPLHLRHQTVIQTLEGSTRTNVNPWEAFDHADSKAFTQLYRNDTMKSALDLAKAYPNTIGQEFVPVKAGYQPKAGEMVVGHYQNGNPDLYAVQKYLGETMERVPLAVKSALGIFANYFAHVFKKGATIANIGFQASSLLAHALTGMMVSKYGVDPGSVKMPIEVVKFFNDWRKAAKDVLNNGQFVRELTRYGGASGTFQAKVDPEYFASPSELGWRGKLAKGQVIEVAQDLALALENINRTNIFMRARQSGATAKAAAWEASQFSGMPDFSRLGDISQPLNHIFMFFNAANQYPHQVSIAARKNPERVFGWLTILTAMTIALSSWNLQQNDSRGNNLLRKETTFDRQRNWIIELPWTYHTHAGAEKGITVKIPKPYIARLLNPVEDVINYGVGKESRTGAQQALDSMSNVSPIHLNLKADDFGRSAVQSGVSALHPFAKFGIQQFANVDDYGRPIVPPSQQGIEPEFQQGPYTSAVATRMGEGGVRGAVAGGALGGTLGGTLGYTGAAIGGGIGAGLGAAGISPRRIDVGVRSLTAGAGTQAESLLDPFFGGIESKRQLEGPEKLRNIPVVGALAGRFTASPSDAEFESLSERYYTAMQKAEVVKTTAEYLLKQGRGQEAAKYIQDNQPALHQAMVLSRLLEPIKMLNQRLRQIQASPEANSEAGRKAIESIYESRMSLLRAAKNLLDAAPEKSGDTTPMGGSITSTVK